MPSAVTAAAGRVVEPGDQLDQGGLARAGLADEGDGLSGRDAQVDAGEGLLARRRPYAKETSSNAISPRSESTSSGSSAVGGGGGLAQQLLDAAEGDGGLLVAVEDLGELLDGGEEQLDVEEVGDQGAGGQRAGVDPARADDQHGGRGDRGQELDEREVDGDQPLAAHPGLAVAVAALGEAVGAVVLAAEGLDDPETRRRTPGGRR